MRNRITVIALASLLLVSLQAALSRSAFDDQIARIRQLVAGNDLHVATGTTMSLRGQVVSREELRVDFAASRDLLQRDGASIAVMLTNLQSAQDRFRAGDSRGAAQALDVVAVLLITLEHSADPVTRYSEATRAMAAETAQKGDAGPSTLHYSAVAAYDAGRYSESVSLVQRELRVPPILPGLPMSESANRAHTLLGLDYVALGNDAGAIAELQAAGAAAANLTVTIGPSMALAARLLPQHPDEVRAYLDLCSRIQGWRERAEALAWKQQIENGQTPDFGYRANWR